MVNLKTLVIGASTNPIRYSYKLVSMLKSKNIPVVPMGPNQGKIESIEIVSPLKPQENIHTVSFYIRPILQEKYFDFVINLEPKRVLFNPGTENYRFNKLLDEKNIFWENSCSLVLLSTNQY
ncbi:MAG: CoA-binding protein [Flavobacteriaceae bacterium TMED68]|nr:MAG: CoA-binding protein [Flavobacteriaceae bacterium TMED68]|tara:strand:- start:77089 stop:77454 length:366 start_codon:yes stop_codon:yes gene_type:complete